MLLRPASRIVAGVALAAVLGGCESPPAAPADGAPLVGVERRPARAAAVPAEPLVVAIPPGAKRAVLLVAATTGRRWAWGHATVEARVAGAANALATARIPIDHAADGAWTRLDASLPGDARELELVATDSGRARRIWWSVRFEGLAPLAARNILLVSLDTMRADAAGCLGQALGTTPNLDMLAARGTLFSQAISAAPWTLPSHVSMMTGVLPSWHGRTDVLRLDRDLPPLPTLATILGEHGWETAAFTGSGSISWALGTTRGFSLIVEHEPTRENRWWRREAAECVRGATAVVRWLEDRATREDPAPFLLFWHTYEPHFPYHDERFVGTKAPLPTGIAEDAREDWLRYLGDVAKADACLGGIIDALDRLGLADMTDIVVVSDHGEEFGERSGGRREEATRHGHGLSDIQLRVPLVVVSPSVEPGRRDEQVSLLDVFPTILAFAGLDAPSPAQGHALQVPGGDPIVAAEALYARYVEAEQKTLRESSGLKYVATLSRPPADALFDVATDPLESRSIAAERVADVDRLRGATIDLFGAAPPVAMRAGQAAATGEGLDPQVLESLRSLGYVE